MTCFVRKAERCMYSVFERRRKEVCFHSVLAEFFLSGQDRWQYCSRRVRSSFWPCWCICVSIWKVYREGSLSNGPILSPFLLSTCKWAAGKAAMLKCREAGPDCVYTGKGCLISMDLVEMQLLEGNLFAYRCYTSIIVK